MMEMVLVGEERLVGEVIGINDQKTTIQVYENTTGSAHRGNRCTAPVDRCAPP